MGKPDLSMPISTAPIKAYMAKYALSASAFALRAGMRKTTIDELLETGMASDFQILHLCFVLDAAPRSLATPDLPRHQRARLSRLDYGWSRDDLAEASGVSVGVISKLESGVSTGFDTWLRLAHALDMTVDEYIGESPKEKEAPV